MGLIWGLLRSLKGSSEWEVCWKEFVMCRGYLWTPPHQVGSRDLTGAWQ